jgi:anti-anti-sigma factor
MPLPPVMSKPEREDVGDVTVLRYTIRAIYDDHEIQTVFEHLQGLVEVEGRRKLVLDFGSVRAIASSAIARLLGLHKDLQASKGRLVLCNLTPLFAEILEVMQLDRYLHIYPTEQDALQTF